MEDNNYPVRMYCPISKVEEWVYFEPKKQGDKWILRDDRFAGCNNQWSSCEACEACRIAAFDKIMNERK